MTNIKAIEAMIKGEKVAHSNSPTGEYAYFDGGFLYNESGEICSLIQLNLDCHDDDWLIYKEEDNNLATYQLELITTAISKLSKQEITDIIKGVLKKK